MEKSKRQLRIEAREARRQRRAQKSQGEASGRQRRREGRAKRRAEQLSRDDKLRSNTDPLQVVDRFKASVGHVHRDQWRGCSAFLVCGGPSVNALDTSVLRERGIMSLAINNVAGHIPVRAMTFSDPVKKFHHGIWFDGSIQKWVPEPKLKEFVRIKRPDGQFVQSDYRAADCPNVIGYRRDGVFIPEDFLTRDTASWGTNKKGVAKTGRPKVMCSMLLGIRLLHYFGVRRIFMLGVDFAMDSTRGNYGNYSFGEERDKGAVQSNNHSYRVVNEMLVELRPYLDRSGLEVYNCNPLSGLRAFDHIPFGVAAEDCRGKVPREPFDLAGWYIKK